MISRTSRSRWKDQIRKNIQKREGKMSMYDGGGCGDGGGGGS
jgi:hypothetical protein